MQPPEIRVGHATFPHFLDPIGEPCGDSPVIEIRRTFEAIGKLAMYVSSVIGHEDRFIKLLVLRRGRANFNVARQT